MDGETLRRVAHEEITQAFARYIARCGDESEVFASSICSWLAAWFEFFTPDTPELPRAADPRQEQQWDEALQRARRDLELHGEPDGP